ncbi:MAG: hypothetical protein N2109_07690 [Fimbriimonadales bacterium]|nr:hypothetical protein [Fimbriimonadales bacterium]
MSQRVPKNLFMKLLGPKNANSCVGHPICARMRVSTTQNTRNSTVYTVEYHSGSSPAMP